VTTLAPDTAPLFAWIFVVPPAKGVAMPLVTVATLREDEDQTTEFVRSLLLPSVY
jgi:hypothetical protein